MKNISLVPTHVLLTTNKLIGAWSGKLVSVIRIDINSGDYANKDVPDVLTVMLFNDEEAADAFTEINRHLYEDGWSVTPSHVLKLYGNKRARFNIEWLPDDTLLAAMRSSDLRAVHTADDIETGLAAFSESTKIAMREYYCTCQTVEYGETMYYYATEECAVHGKLNPRDIASCVVHRTIPLRMTGSFAVDKHVDMSGLHAHTIYGIGESADGTRGLYTSTPNSKFGHSYYFVPASNLTEEEFLSLETMYPTIRIIE